MMYFIFQYPKFKFKEAFIAPHSYLHQTYVDKIILQRHDILWLLLLLLLSLFIIIIIIIIILLLLLPLLLLSLSLLLLLKHEFA